VSVSNLRSDPQFLELLIRVGSDFTLTQGFGGNASYKSNGKMLVKSSGMRLGDVDSANYFYEVEVSNGEYKELGFSQIGKPSIEVFLHAMLPQRYVVHLHSAKGVAVSMLMVNNGVLQEQLKKLQVSMVPYQKPGIELKKAIKNIYSHSPSDGFLLKNHGTLFGADSVDQLSKRIHEFEEAASEMVGEGLNLSLSPAHLDMDLDFEAASHFLWHAQTNWRISPDHVVFLGSSAPKELIQVLTKPCSIRQVLKAVFPTRQEIGPHQEQLLWFMNVVQYLPLQPLSTLTEDDAKDLINWDAEKHRLRLAENQNFN